jgi:hypothetical protein
MDQQEVEKVYLQFKKDPNLVEIRHLIEIQNNSRFTERINDLYLKMA